MSNEILVLRHKLIAAIQRSAGEALQDEKFVMTWVQRIPDLRQEFGKGFLLFELGMYDLREDVIIPKLQKQHQTYVQSLYLDETSFKKYVGSININSVWDTFSSGYLNCPESEIMLLFMASIDHGEGIYPRYSNGFEGVRFDLGKFKKQYKFNSVSKTNGKVKPEKITNYKINKWLDQEKPKLLILDASDPRYTGKNLEKWVSVIKSRQQLGKPVPKIVIESSPAYPAVLPPDLQDNLFTISGNRLI